MQSDNAPGYTGDSLPKAADATGACRRPTSAGVAMALLLAGLLSACAVDRPLLPEPLNLPVPARAAASDTAAVVAEATRIDRLPNPAARKPAAAAATVSTQAAAAAVAAGEPVLLNLEQVPLATFAQLVFADVLKKNVNIDAQVLARKDLVTFRSGNVQTAAQLEVAAVLLLKSYGVAAIDLGGLVRVLPDNANLGNLPEIRRGAALPETPLPLRPIFYMVDLQAVRHLDVANWLRTLFGDRVRAQEDPSRNALLISGTPDNVQAALEAIRMLDQPVLAGGQSLAINPVHWSADDLARRMNEVLMAQGYAVQPQGQVGQPGGIRYPIVILPVASINAVFVFARGDEVVKHIADLARSLDKPNERSIGKNFFTYAVKHKDATLLAETLQQLLSGVTTATATPAGQTTTGTAAAAGGRTNVVIDKSTNTLIFQAGQDGYSQIISLLQTLDRPSKSALIEVTVAELSTDDSTRLGVEWASTEGPGSGGTLGGLGLGTGGFTYRVLNAAGGLKSALNALATANRATILSSPRVLARNGETATIQVGQEVPIVTSQQSAGSTIDRTQVLQTIQYRSTGVILKVKPVIHSGDQIDLDVSQEVSNAQSTNTGVSASPTFSTRKLETKLTMRNGSTVLLGGLISEDSTRGGSGVPLFKDVPVLGYLFSNQSQTNGRRELIVLITPYLINDNHDAESVTEAFRRMLGPWAAPVAVPRAPPLAATNAAPITAPITAPVTTPLTMPLPPPTPTTTQAAPAATTPPTR